MEQRKNVITLIRIVNPNISTDDLSSLSTLRKFRVGQQASDGSLGDGSLGDGSLGDASLGDGSLSDGSLSDGFLSDGSSGHIKQI